MTYLLRDFLRADCEGDWNLHLHCLKSLLQMVAAFDRTNYLRWASIYYEDMMKVETELPELHEKLLAGQFVVKRTPGKFKAVGADMCLEQTINKSQKSSGGIIGSTKKKQYVAKWELLYHEMLGVGNLFRELSGVNPCNTELTLNHEFRIQETIASEMKIADMVSFIVAHDNPCHVSTDTEPQLHNIMSQEIMTPAIRESLLNIDKKGEELYATFRRERYINKCKKLSDPIHRNMAKTFKDIRSDPTRNVSKKNNEQKKDFANAQRLIDLARVREYDMKHLFEYELVSSSYLFDDKAFMTDPHKSTLCTELEKNLRSVDFVKPQQWPQMKCTYVVDVMANIRKLPTLKLKTFGDLLDTFIKPYETYSHYAFCIDFVFDTYIEGSVKDSERVRRTELQPIDINQLTAETPLPKEMGSFWSSITNKHKLQLLLRQHIASNEQLKKIDIVLSECGIDGDTPCSLQSNNNVSRIQDLD